MTDSDAMSAEFDTVAEWTAEAALALGHEHYVPAGCRGSGGPAALDWLLDRLEPEPRWPLLDVGAGVGGPAGYALAQRGVRSVLAEPEAGACRAARTLFRLPVLRADAAALPFPADAFWTAWCLGVLCTTPDHRAVLEELRRVVRPGGRVGLLVYVTTAELSEQPEGNNFPSRAGLPHLVEAAGFESLSATPLADLPDDPTDWQRRMDAVHAEAERRHGADDAWRTAEEQQQTMAELLQSGEIVGELLCLRVSVA
jgi:SAM-dependent methyltransferase